MKKAFEIFEKPQFLPTEDVENVSILDYASIKSDGRFYVGSTSDFILVNNVDKFLKLKLPEPLNYNVVYELYDGTDKISDSYSYHVVLGDKTGLRLVNQHLDMVNDLANNDVLTYKIKLVSITDANVVYDEVEGEMLYRSSSLISGQSSCSGDEFIPSVACGKDKKLYVCGPDFSSSQVANHTNWIIHPDATSNSGKWYKCLKNESAYYWEAGI